MCCYLAHFVRASLWVWGGRNKVEKEGKWWLGTHTEAAAVNVTGEWHDKAWGRVTLSQAEGTRQVTGSGDGWNIDGVVSGNKVFLIFSSHGNVEYSAELSADAPNALNGSYARGVGLEGSKTKPMNLRK
ncbi:MAG: hypothetical protein ABSH05_06660 [Bryobacteraceae bacterium]